MTPLKNFRRRSAEGNKKHTVRRYANSASAKNSRATARCAIITAAPGCQGGELSVTKRDGYPWRAPGRRLGACGRGTGKSLSARFSGYSFGSVRVDGVAYDHDLIIDCRKIRKRRKGVSRKLRGRYGHTPLSAAEDIPWRCCRLAIGTGADGALPVMQEVREQARRRDVELVVLPTAQAIGVLAKTPKDTSAILHLTC